MVATNAMRIVFLCSGGGGNLCFVHQAIERGWIKGVDIAAVVTDRHCQASRYAASVGMASRVLDFVEEGQGALLGELKELRPDLIITTVHKILQQPVVQDFRGKLVNLHYSILPAFGGMIGAAPVKAAIAYGARFTGVTTHFVTEDVDSGRPIVQAVVPLRAGEADFEALMNVVFRCGSLALLASINSCLAGAGASSSRGIPVGGRTCLFSGNGVDHLPDAIEDDFWHEISRKVR